MHLWSQRHSQEVDLFGGVKNLWTSSMEIWGLARVSERGSESWFSLEECGGLGLVEWGSNRTWGLTVLWNDQGAGSFLTFLSLNMPLLELSCPRQASGAKSGHNF